LETDSFIIEADNFLTKIFRIKALAKNF